MNPPQNPVPNVIPNVILNNSQPSADMGGDMERMESPTRWRFIIAFVFFVLIVALLFLAFKQKETLEDLLKKCGILPATDGMDDGLTKLNNTLPRRIDGSLLLVTTLVGDPRENGHPWKQLLTNVSNQKDCSSCWAFAVADMVRDRYCIYKGEIIANLSAQSLLDAAKDPKGRISACKSLDKCQCGEFPGYALDLARVYGVAEESCDPYRASNANLLPGSTHRLCQTAPNCFYTDSSTNDTCKRYNFKSIFVIDSEEKASLELKNNGTLMTVIGISDWFYKNQYKKGVLKPPATMILSAANNYKYDALHAVCIVGETNNAWVIRNSWGTSIHDKGFFLLQKKVNALGMMNFGFYGGYF
jgi:hypothetical protein